MKRMRQCDLDAYIGRKRARKARLEATARSEAAASFLLLNNDVPEPDPGPDLSKGTRIGM